MQSLTRFSCVGISLIRAIIFFGLFIRSSSAYFCSSLGACNAHQAPCVVHAVTADTVCTLQRLTHPANNKKSHSEISILQCIFYYGPGFGYVRADNVCMTWQTLISSLEYTPGKTTTRYLQLP